MTASTVRSVSGAAIGRKWPIAGQDDVLRTLEMTGLGDVWVEHAVERADDAVDHQVGLQRPDHRAGRDEHPHAPDQEPGGVPRPGERRVERDHPPDPAEGLGLQQRKLGDEPTLAVRHHDHVGQVQPLQVLPDDLGHGRDRPGVEAELVQHVHGMTGPEQVLRDRLHEPPAFVDPGDDQDRRLRPGGRVHELVGTAAAEERPDHPVGDVHVVQHPAPEPSGQAGRRRHGWRGREVGRLGHTQQGERFCVADQAGSFTLIEVLALIRVPQVVHGPHPGESSSTSWSETIVAAAPTQGLVDPTVGAPSAPRSPSTVSLARPAAAARDELTPRTAVSPNNFRAP